VYFVNQNITKDAQINSNRRDQRGLSLRFTVCRSPRIPLDRARSPPQKPALVTDGIRLNLSQ